MGTVLVIFSFFRKDNAPYPPHARPPGPHMPAPLAPTYVKKIISIEEKKLKIMYNLILVWVLFLFFSHFSERITPPARHCSPPNL